MLDEDELAAVITDLARLRAHVAAGGRFEDTVIAPDGFGRSPLELAAIVGAPPEVVRFVADHTSDNRRREALLGFASEDRDLARTCALVDSGAAFDLAAALERAAGNSNPKTVYLLLRKGAPITADVTSAASGEVIKDMLDRARAGTIVSPYDLVDLDAVRAKVRRYAAGVAVFARTHATETFYAFAIDAGRLRANSEEQLAKEKLRFSVGDWRYRIDEADGDITLDDHALARRGVHDDRTFRDLVVDLLASNIATVFAGLRLAADFRVFVAGVY